MTSHSGGFSMWRMPAPAVIHWVSPFVIVPPPPFESWCSNVPSIMYVTVSKPRCGCHGRALGLAGRVLDLAHLVHVDERVEVGQVDARERAPDREPLAFEAGPRDRQPADRALAGDGRIRLRDPGQDGDVVDGDGGHGLARCWRLLSLMQIVAQSTITVKHDAAQRTGHGVIEPDAGPEVDVVANEVDRLLLARRPEDEQRRLPVEIAAGLDERAIARAAAPDASDARSGPPAASPAPPASS